MNIEDKIAKLCLDKYASLKKSGKPNDKEWTILSGIVLQNEKKELFVVSLCTGTKCLNGTELKNTKYECRGNRLSDSHAEILARRAFLRYLYYQIDLAVNNEISQIFYLKDNKIQTKDVSFHFFSSQTPCGDCSIIPIQKNECDFVTPFKKVKSEQSCCSDEDYGEQAVDVHRTGAKCVENDKQDMHGKGVDYHIVGPLRTKPGRGDRTLSLSCSDKIAKWNLMGVQGALLSLMIPTIRLKSIIIGGSCPFSIESMQRGLGKRFSFQTEIPDLFRSTLTFEHIKGPIRTRPCPASIVWSAVSEKNLEVAVDGLKQGVTKKGNQSKSLLISRKELFKTFLKTYDKFCNKREILTHPKKLTYYNWKQYSTTYQKLWNKYLNVIPTWPRKPLYLQECLSF